MRVGWLADEHTPPGGAELTAKAFAEAAPLDREGFIYDALAYRFGHLAGEPTNQPKGT